KAFNAFMKDNKFSLNANAGLTLVNWSREAQGNAGTGDITVWSGTEGLFGGVAVSVTDVNYDEKETAAYYGKRVAVRDILGGKVMNPRADELRQAIAATSTTGTAATTGTSGTRGTTGTGTTNPPPKEGYR
ncbi:MAG TPA: YSC84-related protein, partial [Telluria sp.]|nr:YSC84-related protein [Telluria sp.]